MKCLTNRCASVRNADGFIFYYLCTSVVGIANRTRHTETDGDWSEIGKFVIIIMFYTMSYVDVLKKRNTKTNRNDRLFDANTRDNTF